MAVDPNIKKKADDIRNKIYGKEVRESLASGLEEMSSDVVENEGRQSVVEGRQDSVESQWQAVSDEMTDKDVISAPEIIAARNGEENLKARLDKEKNEVSTQLAQIAINVKSFGAVGDGLTDDSESFKNAINSLSNKQKLYIPDGIYNLESWEVLSIDKEITIEGQSKENTTLVGHENTDFIDLYETFNASNLTIEDFNTLFHWRRSEVVADEHSLILHDIKVRNTGHVLVGAENATPIKSLDFFNNDINTNFKGHGILWSGGIKNANVYNSKFRDIERRAIHFGNNTPQPVDTWENINIRDNVIENVDGLDYTSAYGIIVYGTDIIIKSNTIKNVYGGVGNDTEGIYTKTRNCVVDGNILINAGSMEGSIVLKTPSDTSGVTTRPKIVSNNIINDTNERTVGITVASSDVMIINNRINGCSEQAVLVSGSQFNNILIKSNLISNIGLSGILVWGSGNNVEIENNVFKDMGRHGLEVDSKSDEKPYFTGWSIKDNLFDTVELDAINFRMRTGTNRPQYKGLTISGNKMLELRNGINITADASVETPNFAIRDNTFNDNVDNPIKIGASGLSNTSECYLSNNVGAMFENEGVSKTNPGDSGINVAHGLVMTPKLSDIFITPNTHLIDNGYRISTISASVFRIEFQKVVAEEVTFAWRAEIKKHTR